MLSFGLFLIASRAIKTLDSAGSESIVLLWRNGVYNVEDNGDGGECATRLGARFVCGIR